MWVHHIGHWAMPAPRNTAITSLVCGECNLVFLCDETQSLLLHCYNSYHFADAFHVSCQKIRISMNVHDITCTSWELIDNNFDIFTHVMLASVGISCRHVSICLSTCLLQVDVLLKWPNVGSYKQRHMIAQGLSPSSFITPKVLGGALSSFQLVKISAKLRWGHPQWRHQMQA